MVRVFDLDADGDEDCDVEIYIPGPGGVGLVDVGSRLAPTLITGSIAQQLYPRQRSFIQGSGGPVVSPTIPNPPSNSPWELYLFGTDDTNTVTFENASNLKLSGECILRNGSILYLQWDGHSMYVEGGRNEV